MTGLNLVLGMEILSNYMKKNDRVNRKGNTSWVNVIFDEVSNEDSEKLQKLGWHAIDDRWGFEEDNEFNKYFNSWFDARVRSLTNEDCPQEIVDITESLCKAAIVDGVNIGMLDSKLSKSCVEG
jgi:hypothetical protein